MTDKDPIDSRRGIVNICFACLLSAVVATLIQVAHRADGGYSGFVNSFVRVLANVGFVVGHLRLSGGVLQESAILRRNLWLWGVFGAATVFTFFDALSRLPSGKVALLYAGHTFLITLLRPSILGQKNSLLSWFAVLGGLVGLFLIAGPGRYSGVVGSGELFGILEALASGLFAALAYLMVAKIGRTCSTRIIMRYWFVSALASHLVMMGFMTIIWPRSLSVWSLLIIAGLLASLAQFLTARGFQELSATRAAALSFLAPVFTLAMDASFFGLIPSTSMLIGTAMILVFGVYLPIQHAKV